MVRHSLSLVLLLAFAGLAGADQPSAPIKDKAAFLFGSDKVWSAHLTMPAASWDAIQPSRSPGFFGMAGAPKGKDKAKEQPLPGQPRGAFGFDFEYARADLEFNGKTWKDVGVRFKGNSSYAMSSTGLKRPFKVDFNRFVDGQEFYGLKMINLANNAFDPSQLREALACSVFRAAGVPAARTAFVELYLTVPGKFDHVLVGLYTLIEEVDGTFLKHYYPSSKGLLLKPEGIHGIPYLGPDWKRYEDRLRPKKEGDAKAKERYLAFTRLVNFADDEEFNKTIGQMLNVDNFLRYVAACSAMVNQDSFVGIGHNYYLYLNPADNRFNFIPWDLNNTFGGLAMFGGVDQQIDWNIARPWLGRNRLVERVLANDKNAAAYREHLRALIANSFKPDELTARLDRMQQAIQPTLDRVAKEKKGQGDGGMGLMGLMIGQPAELKKFVTRRAEAVSAQLDGKGTGKPLGMGPGFMGQREGLGNQVAKRLRPALDTDMDGKLSWDETAAGLKQMFADCDKDKKGVLDEAMLAGGLRKLLTPPPGFFNKLVGGPPASDAGQGVHLAGYVCYKLRKDRLKPEDLQGLVEKLFRAADADKDGLLDEKELTAGLNALPPASPSWGPPPAPPKPVAAGKP